MKRYWFRYGVAVVALLITAPITEAFIGAAVPPRIPLQAAPTQIGPWHGSSERLDEEFLQRARPDEFIFRRYLDNTGRSVLLYVGYYGRKSARAQTQALCYGECEVRATDAEVIDLGGRTITVNRGWVEQNKLPLLVLYWYQQGSLVSNDSYQAKVDQLKRVLASHRSDGALIRVSAPIGDSFDTTHEQLVRFVKALFPVIRQHLPD